MTVLGTFKFKGGQREFSNSGIRANYKFYCFAVWGTGAELEEVIFHTALKRGIFEKISSGVYGSHTSTLKIFMSSKGFGVPTMYQSFFFKLDGLSERQITITPFGSEVSLAVNSPEQTGAHFFQSRGSFLPYDDIARMFGKNSPTMQYYDRQTIISRSEMRKLIDIRYVSEDGNPAQVRMIRT